MNDNMECWSSNNEDFRYESLGDLLDSNEDLSVGDVVYRGVAVRPDSKSFVSAGCVIDLIGDRAYDSGGEWAQDYPEVSEADVQRLQDALDAWIESIPPPSFWSVEKVEKYELTADDLSVADASK